MHSLKPHSPQVKRLAWGRMTIEGLGTGKDFKLWPGGGRPWDWTENKTNHRAGIQPGDVAELIEHGCTTVVLSQGMLQRLAISNQTLTLLEINNVGIHVAKTKQAVKLYNKLAAEGIAVGGLFHTTC
jgi:hypothetical protein